MDEHEVLQHRGRGRQPDYVVGTVDHGWSGFDVVRFHAIEEISRPFAYDIVVTREAAQGVAALDPLIDTPASFRVATEGRWRPVHGIIAEAEEIERTSKHGIYRFLLVPHLHRARYRRRCRNFIGRTIEQIVSSVLENRAPAFESGAGGLLPLSEELTPPDAEPSFSVFKEPKGFYRWAVSDGSRIRNATIRPYVVQYNESDLDFVARLLEEEGICYFFEHGQDACVMTLTDKPGKAPLFERDSVFRWHGGGHGGTHRNQEVIRTAKEARRMRSRAVTARDFSWKRSRTLLEAQVNTADGAADASGHFEFPVRDEEVEKDPCMAPARFRMQRFEAERSLCSGSGTVRTMEPGHRFTLHDLSGLRDDAEHLIVRVETFATQRAPKGTALDREPFGFPGTDTEATGYENEFVLLPAWIDFRPAQTTPKPRIDGIQTALVTAEEMPGPPEINCDKQGRVRVRFPWDQREPDNQSPSSDWIRVSQAWAGGAFGAVHIPRVGHEVLVAYLQGDPDRPLVVGRVYNEQTPPPYDLAKDPTVSTVKSRSSPSSNGYNEFRFEDKAKHEQIYLHAQRNFDEVVLANHTTVVGHDEKNTVKHDQTDQVDNDRTHIVGNNEVTTVWGERESYFKKNELRWIDGTRNTVVHTDENLTVKGKRCTTIGEGGGYDYLTVHGPRTANIHGDDRRVVTGNDQIGVDLDRSVVVSGEQRTLIGGDSKSRIYGHLLLNSKTMSLEADEVMEITSNDMSIHAWNDLKVESTAFYLDAGSAKIRASAGNITIDNGAGTSISLVGDKLIISAGAVIAMSKGDAILLAGNLMANSNQEMTLTSGTTLSGTAPLIKWNG